MTEPTAQDHANAATRQAIADKFRREYVLAESLACSVFGPGWKPTGYNYLVEKDAEDEARRTNTKPPAAATVISATKDGKKRHFRVETMTECDTPEAGFGGMLLEPHPTKGFEHRGQWCRIHRYSLCWGCFEADYRPASAEKLAEMRAKREEKAVEKEAAGSLFADVIRAEGPARKGRNR
ncbi:MAG TPA: hypothetical protein VD866_00050 [Urbifossiella sp.]|nr:hypothetical protein [Urbifossiella sp.]